MGLFSDILLTVDYDRTMTAPDSSVPQRNLEAIRYFMDHGGLFTLNTGRSLPMARPLMEKIPYNTAMLLYNGSAAYENGQLVNARPIELDMGETLRRVSEAFPDLTVELQGIHAHVNFKQDSAWENFVAGQGAAWAYGEFGEDLGPFLKFAVYGPFRRPEVNELFQPVAEDMARIDELEAWLAKTFGDSIEVFRSGARFVDVQPRGVSKALAAQNLKKRTGRKWLVCVGDAENDAPMLEVADFGYCPCDAAVADRFENVCASWEGAVADVIYKKIPEILEKSLDI